MGDIKGESTDDKHKGEIDVLSWAFGAEQIGGAGKTGHGGGASKAQFHDLVFKKYIDASSPKLFLACAAGTHLPEVTLTARKAGGDSQVEYLKIKLQEVIITSCTTGTTTTPTEELGVEGLTLPLDEVHLNYAKIEFNYKAQNADGTAGANTQAGWDAQANKKL
jgi:type VI secretion system secreted protein Hcp